MRIRSTGYLNEDDMEWLANAVDVGGGMDVEPATEYGKTETVASRTVFVEDTPVRISLTVEVVRPEVK